MRFQKLSEQDRELIQAAFNAIKKNRFESKEISASVGCALLTEKGNTFTGINLKNYFSSPVSICAETATIAQMFSSGEKKINSIVAVHLADRKSNKSQIITPCGACRQIISAFGNPWIIISKTKKARLKELYPMQTKPNKAQGIKSQH